MRLHLLRQRDQDLVLLGRERLLHLQKKIKLALLKLNLSGPLVKIKFGALKIKFGALKIQFGALESHLTPTTQFRHPTIQFRRKLLRRYIIHTQLTPQYTPSSRHRYICFY